MSQAKREIDVSSTVVRRAVDFSCPWFDVVVKSVRRPSSETTEEFHCIQTPDYQVVLAITVDELIPLVRQFRPAVEQIVVELPSGYREQGESSEDAARRELREETGCVGDELLKVNEVLIDSGRMTTMQHGFVATAVRRFDSQLLASEPLNVVFVSAEELHGLIDRGQFKVAGHLAVVYAACARGFIPFPPGAISSKES